MTKSKIMPGCRKVKKMMSLYIDGMLSEKDENIFLAHIGRCGSCKKEFNSLKAMAAQLGSLPKLPLDEKFHAETMALIKTQKALRKKNAPKPTLPSARLFTSRAFVRLGTAAASFLVVLLAASSLTIGISSAVSVAPKESGPAAGGAISQKQHQPVIVPDFEGGERKDVKASVYGVPEAVIGQSHKLEHQNGGGNNALRGADASLPALNLEPDANEDIWAVDIAPQSAEADSARFNPASADYMVKNTSITLETENIEDVLFRVKSMDVNISNSVMNNYSGGNQAEVTLNVPKENYAAAVSSISAMGSVQNMYESSYSVAEQINDASVTLSVKTDQFNRLKLMLNQADTLENMIKVENSLSSVINELDYQEGRLRTFYNQADNFVINLSLHEAASEAAPDALSGRLQRSFDGSVNMVVDSAGNVAVAAAGLFVPIIIIAGAAALVCAAVFLVRKAVRRRS